MSLLRAVTRRVFTINSQMSQFLTNPRRYGVCGGGTEMVGLTGGNEYACMEARLPTRWAYRGSCGGKRVSHGLFIWG